MSMSLAEAIKPKSDQLNYDDFITGPKVIQIKTIKEGTNEQPYFIVPTDESLEVWKPCKSMLRVLVAVWGDKGKEWIGKSIKLFGEPTVKWAGKEIGGIRISHMSGIDKPITIKLTVSRGKRVDFTVSPLATN